MSFQANNLGTLFSPYPTPQIRPTSSSPHILVIGGGVTGLTSACVLLDHGYKVTIIAKEWCSYSGEQRLTSQIAGALWEYPPAVCGAHTDTISLSNSRRWCMLAYEIWGSIAADPKLAAISGVHMRQSAFFFPCRIENDPAQLTKMREIENSGVRNFRRSANLIQELNVNPEYGAVDAYEHLAPMIDTDIGMKWLMQLVEGKGATLITETIYGDLFSQERDLRTRYAADAIVNATGLAGAEIAGDTTCYPIRGALIRVVNDNKDFEKVEASLTISADAVHDSNEIVFIVPRGENILLIGGIAQPDEWTLDLTLDSPVIQRMRKRCEAFLPGLRNARLDPEYPLAQGLRPFREHNVRVERELQQHDENSGLESVHSRIVHSYGQGGAGWSLSFGCAADVLGLVEMALRDLPAEPMQVAIDPPTARL
jgi:D-amino-acid oxidase